LQPKKKVDEDDDDDDEDKEIPGAYNPADFSNL
jgi:hypothetical protein